MTYKQENMLKMIAKSANDASKKVIVDAITQSDGYTAHKIIDAYMKNGITAVDKYTSTLT